MSVFLLVLSDPDWRLGSVGEWDAVLFDNPRLSRSLMLGLLVFACFCADGACLGAADIARMLDMSSSTAYRYVSTLAVVGLIEQEPDSRRYRIVRAG